MPIVKDGNDVIQYIPAEGGKEFEITRVTQGSQFAIRDEENEVKQLQFSVTATSPGAGVATLNLDVDADVTINMTTGAMPYSVGQPTDWTGTPPATLKEAIDRIAAALGPIA